MADHKNYINQTQDNGSVMISKDVIASIVAQALKDVKGVFGVGTKSKQDAAARGGKNWGKAVRVSVNEKNVTTIDVDIVITYGKTVVSIAEAAQKAIINAVESMTGVKALVVNVNVCGIVRP
ncbi:MAG: Asp23/Gls24 family envelope stress response protein [Ruminococcaceae bacterium]|nr:Asp23/Gls24 family envelope stress response protein [Oscillospiraceae bacterium]